MRRTIAAPWSPASTRAATAPADEGAFDKKRPRRASTAAASYPPAIGAAGAAYTARMRDAAPVVFLFDVDNTLLDNDAVQDDLSAHLEREVGLVNRDRYWEIFEQLREQLGYADYLGALQRYRLEHLDDLQLLRVSLFLLDYPFASRLYPGALQALARCATFGPTVILSDGDVVFQPRKVQRAGLWDAVDGRVLIYLHKERMLADVERRFPAAHYVMIDDKLRILAAMKSAWRERLTTVFPRQGHYALDPRELAAWPAADLTLARIGELADCSGDILSGAVRGQRLP
jgi:FMN phosphatase YigB (HAD superfamily)